MKATMSKTGVITLEAETDVEAYALKNWSGQNLIQVDDAMRAEGCYWRGSGLLVKADTPEAS